MATTVQLSWAVGREGPRSRRSVRTGGTPMPCGRRWPTACASFPSTIRAERHVLPASDQPAGFLPERPRRAKAGRIAGRHRLAPEWRVPCRAGRATRRERGHHRHFFGPGCRCRRHGNSKGSRTATVVGTWRFRHRRSAESTASNSFTRHTSRRSRPMLTRVPPLTILRAASFMSVIRNRPSSCRIAWKAAL